MASAEGGSVPNGVGYGEGCPLSSRLRGLGSVVSSPSGVWGTAPAENGFWHILNSNATSPQNTEHRTLLFVSILQKSEGDNLH